MRHPLRERDVVEAPRRWPRPRVEATFAAGLGLLLAVGHVAD